MAKKLVIDRSLSIKAPGNTSVTVPADEVWKATVGSSKNGSTALGDTNFSSTGRHCLIIGGGAGIDFTGNCLLTGVAFKVVDQ